jgi:hypothetical protein
MDPFLRGTIERHVDTILIGDALTSASEMLKKGLAPAVKNLEEALFGYVVGRVIEFAFLVIQADYYRSPTDEEFDEIGYILKRRAIEIKSKVTFVANR